MELPSHTLKRASLALVVALLMTTAGCSSLAGSDGGAATTETATSDVTETADATTTATPETTAQNETTASDGHSHSHDNESTSNTSNIDAAHTGQMAVMVGSDRVQLAEKLSEEDSVQMDDVDTWYTNESVTLAEALSAADVEATESSLSYDGETYSESEEGTKIIYRVDSHEVDPEEYTLESGDKIWVMVVTDDMDVSTPGEYIPPENLHVHGTIDFTVDGEELDFSRDKYQQAGHNDHFHFEGGHANPWHAHSAHVTLAYAMSTLDGISMTEDTVTYNGTTYQYDGGDATITVNGEPVDPTEYYLKNGDSVSITIESAD